MNYSLTDLEIYSEKYGNPLYIFDEEDFIDNYQHFTRCFFERYDNYRLSYSFKTNYAPYICRLVRRLGGVAEVVSDMEMDIARKVGFSESEIIYNGPDKDIKAFKHSANGGILNIDNFEELENIIQYSNSNPNNNFRLGIRVNIDIGQNFISRFGIDEVDLPKIFKEVKEYPQITIVGLHCHVGRSRSVESWSRRASKMIGLVDRFFDRTPEYISLGSGMYGRMSKGLSSQFGDDLPTYEQYAEAVCTPFSQYFKDDKPILYTEPGTTLINRYMDFIAKVRSIKYIKGKCFVVLNASKHNLGELCELKKLPFAVISSKGSCNKILGADIVGYTCLEHDVLYKDFSGTLGVGDYLVFENVGGYSNVSKPPFIRGNCAMISSNGNIIKHAETTEDVIKTYE